MLIFLQNNSRIITKMVVNQIGMMIFGLVLEMATIQNDTLLLFTSLFAIGFYLVLLYTLSWEAGVSDKIKLDAGRLAYKPFKFVFVSLAANTLNILLGVLAVVGYIINGMSTQPNIQWAFNMYGICNNIARFIQSMYAGVLYFITPNNPFSLLFIAFPAVAICGFGYWLGLKGRTIRGTFGMKTAYDNVLKRENPPKQ